MTAQDLKRSHRAAAVRRRRVVAAIGSGTAADAEACRLVGRLVAELGCDLLTGAGGGTMAAVAQAFCERRDELRSPGLCIGIVPGGPDREGRYATPSGYPNPWVELAVYTHLPRSGEQGRDSSSRNHIVVLSADAVVALPGGAGTQSEVDLARHYGIALIGYGGQGFAGVAQAPDIGHLREFLVNQLSEPVSPMTKTPKDCRDMTEVRAEIDRIDGALVDLVAERFGYVERAWQLKLEARQEANVPWRNQQVVDRVRARAAERGVPPDLIEALWRQMIGWFIQYEEEKLRDRLEGKSGGATER
jgi:isochorismate pyruvate lyase